MEKRILAFDFGASSGRAMLSRFEGNQLKAEEIHRFSNDPVVLNGVLYWDIVRMMFEIKRSISLALAKGALTPSASTPGEWISAFLTAGAI